MQDMQIYDGQQIQLKTDPPEWFWVPVGQVTQHAPYGCTYLPSEDRWIYHPDCMEKHPLQRH